ncbi:MAG: ABC transporter substrate-binding protein [Deltaproteobacteria bacterium]|nr:ABC transporter substrate-binding protein [Deltaproteobacteria bacterium]
MDFKKSLIIILVSLLISGISSSICAAEKPGVIRIGVYLPMTGPMASQGQTEYAGIRIANSIKPEALGRKVELFLVDTAAEDTGTAGATIQLIKENKVCAIIGEISGSDPLGGITIAGKKGTPTVIPAYTESMATKGRRYAFRVCLTDSLQGEAAARYACSNLKARKAAVLMTIDRDHSIELANIFAKNFTRMGGNIVAIAYCQTEDRDFTTQLSSIIAAKPDVLYLPDSYSTVALICRQSVDMGVNTHILSSSNVHVSEFISTGGEYVEGVTFTGDFDGRSAPADIVRLYIDAYEEETGSKTGRFDVLGADAYFLLIDALERAQSTAGPNIRKALADTKGFSGISGVMNMDKDGNVVKEVGMMHVKDGGFQYLETLGFGEQQKAQGNKD